MRVRVLTTVVVTMVLFALPPMALNASEVSTTPDAVCRAGLDGAELAHLGPDTSGGGAGSIEIAVSIEEWLLLGSDQYCAHGCETHSDCWYDLCPQAGFDTRCYKEPGTVGPDGWCVFM